MARSASPLLVSRGTRDGLTARATLVTGLPIELRVTTPDRWAAALLAATGSDGAPPRPRAPRPGAGRGPRARRPGQDEAELYRRLGLPYIPPELREDAGEIEAARAGTLPAGPRRRRGRPGPGPLPHRLLGRQAHRRGDGARRRGARHAVHHDHRPLADRVLRGRPRRWTACARQWDEIARVQEKVTVRLLRGHRVRHPGRRRARLPRRRPRAARRGHREHPHPPPDGRGPDDRSGSSARCAPVLQDLGPRPRPLRPVAPAHRLPHGGGPRRGRGVARGGRDQRRPPPARHGAALGPRRRASAASAS